MILDRQQIKTAADSLARKLRRVAPQRCVIITRTDDDADLHVLFPSRRGDKVPRHLILRINPAACAEGDALTLQSANTLLHQVYSGDLSRCREMEGGTLFFTQSENGLLAG